MLSVGARYIMRLESAEVLDYYLARVFYRVGVNSYAILPEDGCLILTSDLDPSSQGVSFRQDVVTADSVLQVTRSEAGVWLTCCIHNQYGTYVRVSAGRDMRGFVVEDIEEK